MIHNKIYIQGNQIGLASYHFSFDEDGPYISYESAPSFWLLDDGSRPPSKKFF